MADYAEDVREAEFQSTPLCEGRQDVLHTDDDVRMFQSTPLCEGRHMLAGSVRRLDGFQSTPLCEGRLGLGCL